MAKAKRRLKKAPRPVATTTQKPLKPRLTSEERVTLQQWRHREHAIHREQQDLDHRRQVRASEELVRKSWEQETAPKKVANPSYFLWTMRWPPSRRRSSKTRPPTRLEEHTEHAVAISSILKPKDPVPLRKVVATKLAESPERASGASRARAPEAALSASGSAIRPAGGGVAAARTLTNPYKPKPRVAPEVRYEPAAAYAGSRPGMVFKRGDRGVGYYEDPLAPRVLMPTEPTAEPDSEADAADDSDAVLERLKAKLRQDMDAAAPPADDAPAKDEFLRALADADAAADAAAPSDAAEPSPIAEPSPVAEHAPGSSPIDALAAAFASAASPVLVSDAAALRVTTEDLPASEVRLRAAEDAAEDALSKFDAAPLTGNYRGKAELPQSPPAAAEAELDGARRRRPGRTTRTRRRRRRPTRTTHWQKTNFGNELYHAPI